MTREDFGSDDPMAGVEFQDRLERKAFEMGGGEFNAPAQRVSDFLKEEPSTDLPRTSYTQGVTSSNLWDLFPLPIAEGLREAILFFDRKITGFAGDQRCSDCARDKNNSPHSLSSG